MKGRSRAAKKRRGGEEGRAYVHGSLHEERVHLERLVKRATWRFAMQAKVRFYVSTRDGEWKEGRGGAAEGERRRYGG